MRRLFTILGAGLLALGTVTAASAQTATTTYVGPTTPPNPAPSSGSSGTPSLTQGQCTTAEESGFQAASTVGLALNGGSAGSDAVDGNGVAGQNVCDVAGGHALGALRFATVGLHLAATAPIISIDGRQYTARLGTNTITATGTGANGASRTFSFTFVLAASSGNGFAVTGAKIAGFTVVGLALVMIGFVLVAVTRRRRNSTI
jgi:hypothetical protein